MEHGIPLITTLATAFGLALFLGFIAVRLKLPLLVGYLIAGILIGPHTPGFIANIEIAQELAEIGVMLLMFGVGLHFSINDLLGVRNIALPGATLQIIVATFLGFSLAWAWGWGLGGSLVFGLSLSVASTVVLLRALEARNSLESISGRIAVGWLVVEDLVMVIVIVLLPPLAGWLEGKSPGAIDGSLGTNLALTLIKISVFIVLMLIVGRKFFPKILWHIMRTGSRELFTLCVIAAAITVAYLAARIFGVSFALGAFFAGMMMRESPLSQRAAEESLPLREAFSVLFFISVGMLFDPMVLFNQPGQVLAVLSIIIVGKTIAAALLVLTFRYPLHSALLVSASLAQIGEFSFILAGLGVSLGLLPALGQNLILAGALISIALNPLLFVAIDPLEKWMVTRTKFGRYFQKRSDTLATLPMVTDEKYLSGQVVLVGYGRVGSRIGRKLFEKGIPYVVAEQDREIVKSLRAKKIAAVFGDACEAEVLVQTHIANASMLIVAIPDTFNVSNMIKIARAVNRKLEILVRVENEEAAKFIAQEVQKVFYGENELAKNISSYVLNRYGIVE